MNTPSPVPTPAKADVAPTAPAAPIAPIAPVAPAIVSPKAKIARGAEKQHNREVGHMLKAASLHRPTITRSLPHSRGR
jgi:hypothetical protein